MTNVTCIWKEILRRIYGQIQEKIHWDPRWNSEMYTCIIHNYINIVDDIRIRKLGWAGCVIRMEDERILPQKFLIGNVIIQDHWENQQQDVRTSSGGTCHRSQLYEDGGDEQKTEKNRGVFWVRSGPRKGCSAIGRWMDGWMDNVRAQAAYTTWSHWISQHVDPNTWIQLLGVGASLSALYLIGFGFGSRILDPIYLRSANSYDMLRFRGLVAGLSPLRPGFNLGPVHPRLVVEKLVLGQSFLPVLRFCPVSIISPELHIHLTFCHGPYIIAAIESAVTYQKWSRPCCMK